MEIKTLKDLKEFVNSLNDEQLAQEAELSIVDSGAEQIASGVITTEDEYLTDEGFAPVSTFEPSDSEDTLDDYDIRKAGYVYLFNM